jgi:hypothetical protein
MPVVLSTTKQKKIIMITGKPFYNYEINAIHYSYDGTLCTLIGAVAKYYFDLTRILY